MCSLQKTIQDFLDHFQTIPFKDAQKIRSFLIDESWVRKMGEICVALQIPDSSAKKLMMIFAIVNSPEEYLHGLCGVEMFHRTRFVYDSFVNIANNETRENLEEDIKLIKKSTSEYLDKFDSWKKQDLTDYKLLLCEYASNCRTILSEQEKNNEAPNEPGRRRSTDELGEVIEYNLQHRRNEFIQIFGEENVSEFDNYESQQVPIFGLEREVFRVAEKAFWDSVISEWKDSPQEGINRISSLFEELVTEIVSLTPNNETQQQYIIEHLDPTLFRNKAMALAFNYDEVMGYMNFIRTVMESYSSIADLEIIQNRWKALQTILDAESSKKENTEFLTIAFPLIMSETFGQIRLIKIRLQENS